VPYRHSHTSLRIAQLATAIQPHDCHTVYQFRRSRIKTTKRYLTNKNERAWPGIEPGTSSK
jgi:hypothetical protein